MKVNEYVEGFGQSCFATVRLRAIARESWLLTAITQSNREKKNPNKKEKGMCMFLKNNGKGKLG